MTIIAPIDPDTMRKSRYKEDELLVAALLADPDSPRPEIRTVVMKFTYFTCLNVTHNHLSESVALRCIARAVDRQEKAKWKHRGQR